MELTDCTVKRIVIIGPESTGKSAICQVLANHFATIWCPEYAREYLLAHGTDYTFADLLTIAKGQLQQEDAYAKRVQEAGKKWLFIDTDMYVMQVWCEYVFNDCHNWILNQIVHRPYDMYLLCRPDIDWVKDELREYPNEKPRLELYHMYKELMTTQHVPWAEVYGRNEERNQTAIAHVQHWLQQ